jgi:outer membrane protein OmpA-like peptidoglycan-associated protein
MRCNPWRWLWGLVPVALMGWAAVQIEHARIERDLTTRGKEVLAQAGFGWADLSFSGRDGTLSGKAVEESEPARAMETALGTWGIRTVRDYSGLIDKVDRYEWTAWRRDNRIRLNGLVPNEQARRQVIGIVKASLPNLEVDDRLRLARGAPSTDIWLGGVGFGLKQLAQLKNGGRIDLDVASLSVAGEANDVRAYRSVKAALRGAMPPGITLKQDDVTAPVVKPHVWSARRTGDQLTLAGFVPNEKILEVIIAAARDGGVKLKVVDETQPGEGETESWTDAAVAAVRALAELEEGSAELRDAALTFTGLAESETGAAAARKELQQGVKGAFKVSEQVRVRAPLVPIIAPHTTVGDLDGGELTLSGHVPTEDARQALLTFAAARLPSVRVRDTLQLGLGQQPGWQKCVEIGLDALARLGNGRASIVDRKLELAGRTQAEDLAQSLPAVLRNAAGADCETEARIALEPRPEPMLRWSAVHDHGELVLSGQVAGHEARSELVRTAEGLFGGARLTDHMTVVGEASEKWTRAAREGLTQLARLRRGDAQIEGLELTVSGEAREEAVHSSVRETLARQLPAEYRGRETIVVRPDQPPAPVSHSQTTAAIETRSRPEEARKIEVNTCQEMLQATMRTGTIEFERGSAKLDAESLPTLQRLGEVASNCTSVRIEVAGHTDVEGHPDNNQRLSERRAQAVVDFLAEAGVPAARMHAVGHGVSRPLVPNTTDENKARNRRIEFSVSAE